MNALLDDRSCVICRQSFDGGDDGRSVVHCCTACGCEIHRYHSDGMRCRRCKNDCGIDCRPWWTRSGDLWPVKFPWLRREAS